MIIGFTGTSKGMTPAQHARVWSYLNAVPRSAVIHHGDCVGADAEIHDIAASLGLDVHGHPPIDSRRRAWCAFPIGGLEDPAPYLTRDRAIVDACDLLLAAPRQMVEPKAKRAGGTWYTVRYARKVGNPYVIVRPDGTTGRS